MGKEMTTCPHCGEVVKKGNFCNKCSKKLAKICDCWLMKRPYNCNFQQCPDMAAFTLLLLHIQQDQKRRKPKRKRWGAKSCAVLLPLSFGKREPTFTERPSRQ